MRGPAMPDRKPIGPALKVVTLPALLTPFVVSIAALWGGLDWKWIVTSVLVALPLLFAAGVVDGWIEERRQRRARDLVAEQVTEVFTEMANELGRGNDRR